MSDLKEEKRLKKRKLKKLNENRLKEDDNVQGEIEVDVDLSVSCKDQNYQQDNDDNFSTSNSLASNDQINNMRKQKKVTNVTLSTLNEDEQKDEDEKERKQPSSLCIREQLKQILAGAKNALRQVLDKTSEKLIARRTEITLLEQELQGLDRSTSTPTSSSTTSSTLTSSNLVEEEDESIILDVTLSNRKKEQKEKKENNKDEYGELLAKVKHLPVEVSGIIFAFDPTYKRECFSQVLTQIKQLKELCPKCNQIVTNGFSSSFSGCNSCSQSTKPIYWCQSCNYSWCAPNLPGMQKYRRTVSDCLSHIYFLERMDRPYKALHRSLTRLNLNIDGETGVTGNRNRTILQQQQPQQQRNPEGQIYMSAVLLFRIREIFLPLIQERKVQLSDIVSILRRLQSRDQLEVQLRYPEAFLTINFHNSGKFCRSNHSGNYGEFYKISYNIPRLEMGCWECHIEMTRPRNGQEQEQEQEQTRRNTRTRARTNQYQYQEQRQEENKLVKYKRIDDELKELMDSLGIDYNSFCDNDIGTNVGNSSSISSSSRSTSESFSHRKRVGKRNSGFEFNYNGY